MSKVWFKQDDKFFLPKACLNFEFFRSVMSGGGGGGPGEPRGSCLLV